MSLLSVFAGEQDALESTPMSWAYMCYNNVL